MKRRLLDSGVQWDFERGKVTEAVFMGQMEEILGVKMDREKLCAAGSDIFHVNEEMMPVLASLKARGFRPSCSPMSARSHFRWIGEQFDFLRFFDDTVLSYKEGGIKPEPAHVRGGPRPASTASRAKSSTRTTSPSTS